MQGIPVLTKSHTLRLMNFLTLYMMSSRNRTLKGPLLLKHGELKLKQSWFGVFNFCCLLTRPRIESYGVTKKGVLTRENFDLALSQFQIEAKIGNLFLF